MSSDIEKLKRHISPPVAIKLKNEKGEEDTFYLKPLSMAQQALAFELSKKFKKFEGKEDIEQELDKETIDEVFEFVFSIVKKSFPEADEETLADFTSSNFEAIFGKIEELIPKPKDVRRSEKLKKDVGERLNATDRKS